MRPRNRNESRSPPQRRCNERSTVVSLTRTALKNSIRSRASADRYSDSRRVNSRVCKRRRYIRRRMRALAFYTSFAPIQFANQNHRDMHEPYTIHRSRNCIDSRHVAMDFNFDDETASSARWEHAYLLTDLHARFSSSPVFTPCYLRCERLIFLFLALPRRNFRSP